VRLCVVALEIMRLVPPAVRSRVFISRLPPGQGE
jgi:hypothetical protein